MAARFAGLVVCLALVACETARPSHERKPDPRVLIQAEVTPAPEEFTGCHYDPDPVVYVLRDSLLVDGHPMSSVEPEMELRNVLQAKRELEARMENPPKRGLVIQAEEGVPEARVKRIKALAHQMGYYDAQVMRIPAREKPAKAKARRGS